MIKFALRFKFHSSCFLERNELYVSIDVDDFLRAFALNKIHTGILQKWGQPNEG